MNIHYFIFLQFFPNHPIAMSDSQVFFWGGSFSTNRSCASRRAAPGDTLREDPGISRSRSCRLQPLVSRCRNWWSCVWGQMLMDLLLITRGVDEKLRKSPTLNNFHEMLWRKLWYVNLHPVTAAGSESSRMIEMNPLSGHGIDPTNKRSIGIKQKYLLDLDVVVSVALPVSRGVHAAVGRLIGCIFPRCYAWIEV